MKKTVILFTFTFFSLLHAGRLSHTEIKIMVEKIKHQRDGIEISVLETTPNPFAIKEKVEEEIKKAKIEVKKEVKKEVVYHLTAILNHSAFIDGKWYKVGDKIGVFILVSINYDTVDLKSKKEQKKLSIKKEKRKFILNKGDPK